MKDHNIGRKLANRYQILELVGEGAMGRVYRAGDQLLGGVTVAVKFLSQMMLNKKMRERFEREATICALLGEKSIHIVRVRDYGVDENEIPFYVMEFLQGETLSDIILYENISQSRFVNLIRQICLGMRSAHEGINFRGELCQIIHRDIKPGNIFVLQDPSLGELVKILDFGIAKLIQSSGAQTQSFMGTLGYCSPEQMDGKELDKRSDIYSLGVMMYEMLTGEMPLVPNNSSFGSWYKLHHQTPPTPFPQSLNLPEPITKLVMKCLAKSPSDRYQSVDELLQSLEALGKRQNNQIGNTYSEETEQQIVADSCETKVAFEPSIDEICFQASWPKDKPHRQIVFPRLIRTSNIIFPSLWVMLPEEDVLKHQSSIRYNQFLFMSTPHPMVLWITVIYNNQYGPRWLPCYLDLKTNVGLQIIRALGESGSYRLLFFALDNPIHCQNVMTFTIAPRQCQIFQEWARTAKIANSNAQSQVSKTILKQEFQKLKPSILRKLDLVKTNTATDISG